MIYKVASMNNIGNNILSEWHPILDNSFTNFGNRIEPYSFASEDEILSWLEGASRTKSNERQTMIQTFRNGDPNRIYAVYGFNNDNSKGTYLYSLRIRKHTEAVSTYKDERGVRNKSSFKKVNIPFDPVDYPVDFSSSVTEIRYEYFEGIYPLDYNQEDIYEKEYNEFITSILDIDVKEEEGVNNETEYSVVLSNNVAPNSWLYNFAKKLSLVQNYLELYSRRVNEIFKLDTNDMHNKMIEYILKMIDGNVMTKKTDTDTNMRLRNLCLDPILFDGEVYQIRFRDTFLTWHKNYIRVIMNHKVVPSKEFVNVIENFDIGTFYSQHQSDEMLINIMQNLENVYSTGTTFGDFIKFGIINAKTTKSKDNYVRVIKSFAKPKALNQNPPTVQSIQSAQSAQFAQSGQSAQSAQSAQAGQAVQNPSNIINVQNTLNVQNNNHQLRPTVNKLIVHKK